MLSVLRPWVWPTTVTDRALTTALFLGVLIVTLGLVVSRMNATLADGSDSRSFGPTIVAVNVFVPGLRLTPGTRKRCVAPTGSSVTTPGSPSPIAT